jgi:transcriptional regulator
MANKYSKTDVDFQRAKTLYEKGMTQHEVAKSLDTNT